MKICKILSLHELVIVYMMMRVFAYKIKYNSYSLVEHNLVHSIYNNDENVQMRTHQESDRREIFNICLLRIVDFFYSNRTFYHLLIY